MTTMAVSEMRRRLREAVDLARAGEDVNLTVHGEVVAVLTHPEALRSRRRTPAVDQAGDVVARLHRARDVTGPVRTGIARRRATAQVAEIRTGRDVR
ncbi:MAG: type II toxin-antitoxin system Phd/YefM family antitoxin [Dermatophilaceae bacterium]